MKDVSQMDYYSGDLCMVAIEEAGLAVGFCLGNTFKYVYRCGKKHSSTAGKA